MTIAVVRHWSVRPAQARAGAATLAALGLATVALAGTAVLLLQPFGTVHLFPEHAAVAVPPSTPPSSTSPTATQAPMREVPARDPVLTSGLRAPGARAAALLADLQDIVATQEQSNVTAAPAETEPMKPAVVEQPKPVEAPLDAEMQSADIRVSAFADVPAPRGPLSLDTRMIDASASTADAGPPVAPAQGTSSPAKNSPANPDG
ncbi:MAG TPA: hypothetical protein VHW90_15500 [Stellaceae bacterium]|jgi:hypothetical protein|nr:hypothetical protein [Stellaceae bacterium]